MSKILFACLLVGVLGAVALAADPDRRTDGELEAELRELDREHGRHERLTVKLERAGRRSSNADRSRVVADLHEHMVDAVIRRETVLGQEHTIHQHGAEVGGLTDAAEVGTPMASKKTRRRVRKGEAEEHPEALRRLTRLQTLYVSARLLELPAVERQGDAFERYQGLVADFGAIIGMEQDLVQREIDRRAEANAPTAAGADSTRTAR